MYPKNSVIALKYEQTRTVMWFRLRCIRVTELPGSQQSPETVSLTVRQVWQWEMSCETDRSECAKDYVNLGRFNSETAVLVRQVWEWDRYCDMGLLRVRQVWQWDRSDSKTDLRWLLMLCLNSYGLLLWLLFVCLCVVVVCMMSCIVLTLVYFGEVKSFITMLWCGCSE